MLKYIYKKNTIKAKEGFKRLKYLYLHKYVLCYKHVCVSVCPHMCVCVIMCACIISVKSWGLTILFDDTRAFSLSLVNLSSRRNKSASLALTIMLAFICIEMRIIFLVGFLFCFDLLFTSQSTIFSHGAGEPVLCSG